MLFLKKLIVLINKIIIYFILFLIKFIRPFLGPRNVCIYTISCTNYAQFELENNNLVFAIFNIFLRILKCNPIYIYLKSKINNSKV